MELLRYLKQKVKDHLINNLAIFNFELSEEEMSEIDALNHVVMV